MMKKIYISGPMTGVPDLNWPAFHAEAARLRALGYEVINPVEINPDPASPRHECMRADIRALLDCDTMAMLPGWQRSKGAMLEATIALEVGIEVLPVEEIIAPRLCASKVSQDGKVYIWHGPRQCALCRRRDLHAPDAMRPPEFVNGKCPDRIAPDDES